MLPITGVPGLGLPARLLSDERLAKLASRGDARAFATIYARHHQALYRYCRSIVRNDHDAQDALQNAMTSAYAAVCSSEREIAVRPWLFRIAHNEAISILRRRGREDGCLDTDEPSEVGLEHTVSQRERLRMLVADLKALSERQRAALLMRELSGLSIQETAAALSISPGAAKQTLFEARTSLHEFAEGRAMECETVRRAISDADGRVLRSRRIGAHLRGCPGCLDFSALIDTRTADLQALAPALPAGAATAMLARLFAHGGGGHAGGAAAASGAALGGHAAGSLVAKGLVGVVILAAASAGAVHLVRHTGGHRHASILRAPGAVHGSAPNRESLSAHSETSERPGPAGHARGLPIAAARVARPHAGTGHGAPAGPSHQASGAFPSAATPVLEHSGTARPQPHGGTHGNAHRTSGEHGRGSHKGRLTPQGQKHGPRSHSPGGRGGPSTSSQ
ncbi:MAG TPA: RNA polymerase sigma factor, partial [Solirubrobacteraceae bacterium]